MSTGWYGEKMGIEPPDRTPILHPMISVVTAYYNRKELFTRTLETMAQSKVSNYEVVAVDDGSEDNQRLEPLQKEFPFLRVIRLEATNKWYSNPCIPFNIGLREARGEVIILQNPECLHEGDILNYVQESAARGVYLSFACFSLNQEQTGELTTNTKWKSEFTSKIQALDTKPLRDGESGWYNHSIYNPRAYHFCSTIMREDLSLLGGFDERYAGGTAFDDDDLLHRIRMAGLNIRIVDSPFVYHQHHYTSNSNAPSAEQTFRLERNKKLFFHLTLPSTCFRANGEDWGNQNEQNARNLNHEIESILLGTANYFEQLRLGECWQAHSKMVTETLLSNEMLTLIDSSLSVLGTIVEHRRGSLAGKLLWRSRFERLWQEFLKSNHARLNFEKSGDKVKILKFLGKSASSLNLLLSSISSTKFGRFLISDSMSSAIQKQTQTTADWCHKIQTIKNTPTSLKNRI